MKLIKRFGLVTKYRFFLFSVNSPFRFRVFLQKGSVMMKKITLLIVYSCLSFLLVSCSNKKGVGEEEIIVKREVSSKIDMDLVSKLVGNWKGDSDASYPAYGKRTIIEKNGYIFYDNQKLQITDAEKDIIYTQTPEEKPFFYDFRLTGNKLDVLPSYPVPEGMTGGDLMPSQYVKDNGTEIDSSELFGEWQSVDELEVYNISIKQISDGVISYTDNLENKDSQVLIVQKNLEGSISNLTEDERAIYYFQMLENDMIEAFSQVNENYYANRGEDIPVGTSKPIKYKKIME